VGGIPSLPNPKGARVYDDARFNLLKGPTDVFLRFLCEMVHPIVRPDRNEALKLVQQFNDQLRPEGWNLAEVEKVAGRPRYVAVRVQGALARSATLGSQTMARANSASRFLSSCNGPRMSPSGLLIRCCQISLCAVALLMSLGDEVDKRNSGSNC